MNRSVTNVTNVIIVVAFLAALGAWLLLRPVGTGSQVAPAAAPAAGRTEQASTLEKALTSLKGEIATLKGEIATLKREHNRLIRDLWAVEAVVNRAVSLSAQAGTLSEAEEEAETEVGSSKGLSEEQKVANTLYELDLRLSKEPDDPAWSQKAEMDIATLLHSDVMEGSHVLSADCRSTLCQVEVAHEDASAQSWLVNNLPMEPPFDGEMLVRQIGDDLLAPHTLIYLARQGHSLLAATP